MPTVKTLACMVNSIYLVRVAGTESLQMVYSTFWYKRIAQKYCLSPPQALSTPRKVIV